MPIPPILHPPLHRLRRTDICDRNCGTEGRDAEELLLIELVSEIAGSAPGSPGSARAAGRRPPETEPSMEPPFRQDRPNSCRSSANRPAAETTSSVMRAPERPIRRGIPATDANSSSRKPPASVHPVPPDPAWHGGSGLGSVPSRSTNAACRADRRVRPIEIVGSRRSSIGFTKPHPPTPFCPTWPDSSASPDRINHLRRSAAPPPARPRARTPARLPRGGCRVPPLARRRQPAARR